MYHFINIKLYEYILFESSSMMSDNAIFRLNKRWYVWVSLNI